MPRTKKPRNKKYQPRDKEGGLMLLEKRSREGFVRSNFDVPLDEGQQRDIAIVAGVAIAAFAKGQGDHDMLQNIAFMCNTSLVMCEQGFGPDQIEEVKESLDAVWRARLRADQGKYGFDGPGLSAVRRTFVLYEQQLQFAGEGYLMAAGKEVYRRSLEVKDEQETARRQALETRQAA